MRFRPAIQLATCFVLACSSRPDPVDDPEDGFVVDDGKEDNFFSLQATEFVVTGTAHVVVEAGKGEDRARELIILEHTGITWFLNQYLVDKEKEGEAAD